MALNIIRDEGRSTIGDWWACSPLNAQDETPSFHMNDHGWYCHSSGKGGGPLELVQQVLLVRGEHLNIYQAGAWLVENGLSQFGGQMSLASNLIQPELQAHVTKVKEWKSSKQNLPIKANLMPFLERDYYHPKLAVRRITKATCKYLHCGFLPKTSTSGLAGRLVFQVRGVAKQEDGSLKPVILSHLGRAVSKHQVLEGGKWHIYKGFRKSLELYNIDNLLLDERARVQARQSNLVILTEGCFDVAALIEAGILNALASFGSHLSNEQIERLQMIENELGCKLKIILAYDNDKAGLAGMAMGYEKLCKAGW